LGASTSSYAKKFGDSVASGEVFFDINADDNTGTITIGLLRGAADNTIQQMVIHSDGIIHDWFSQGDYGTLSAGWNRIGIKWVWSETWQGRQVYFQLNSGGWQIITAGTWQTNKQYYFTENATGLTFSGYNYYIDTISENEVEAPPIIEGYEPILTPTLPERNAESIVNFDTGFEVSGLVEIPTANTHSYDKLVITFRKPESFFPAKTLSINLGNITGGQSYNYSATTTIPITESGTNFFKVGYALTGSTYAQSTADNPPISEDMLGFDNTWVKDSVEGAPAYLITPSIKPEQDAMEDCGAYSGIDAIVCNLKNFIVGAFLPTDDALAQIGATMNALKNKFPMNYAGAISQTFSTIAAGVDDDAGFSITLFGHTGAVDTSFFTQDIGGGATLGGLIKLVLTFLVFMIFMYWGIGYMHRILNK
jgi:hypothetical protein